MDKYIYLNELYDCYKELFTSKQREYFEEYYFDNLSLSEIADNYQVTRNAVHNELKHMENRLQELEEKLKMNEKKNKIIEILDNKIDNSIMEIIKNILE